MGHSKGSPEREIHIAIQAYLKKTVRKISNRQPNLTSTRTRRTTTKPRARRRKEIRSEQN